MIRQGSGKVRHHSNGGVMSTEPAEEEVGRNCLVRDRGLNGWRGDEGQTSRGQH
jgi:hypothetical protein